MCGIAGFLVTDGRVRDAGDMSARLSAMTDAVAHRGPDGCGTWLEGPVGLGHRRLSIIDLALGSQPMLDVGQKACIVFNGEIYNFAALRQELAAKGYAFATHSDTEVLLACWLVYGESCFEKLEGMFAFAIWERAAKRLIVARDRFGKKPFFYTHQNGIFAFGSESCSLAALPELDLRVPVEHLGGFLAHEYAPTPHSIYAGVRKLEPGHFMIVEDGGRIRQGRYWDIPPPEEASRIDEASACEELRRLLRQATARRLVSDVPLGVFLSGGIDSSLVTGMMSEISSSVKSFSIAFTEKSYDESSYARLVSKHFATDHHEQVLSASECGRLLPSIVERFDEPMSDPSIVPTYLLSQVTRQKVTVALGGDGADELFAGYEHFMGFQMVEKYLKVPGFFRKGVIEPLCGLLPQSAGYVNPRLVAQTFTRAAHLPPWLRVQNWLSSWQADALAAVLPGLDGQALKPTRLYAETKRLYDAFPSTSPLAKVFYLYAKQYMLDYILVKVDRCSMLHGLEVRAPFLDRDVAEFVYRLPLALKLRGFTRKYLLKKAFRGFMPDVIFDRQKRGFLIPVASWLRQELKPVCDEVFSESYLKTQGLFDFATIDRMRREHDSGQKDHRRELWTLLVLQLWLAAKKPKIG